MVFPVIGGDGKPTGYEIDNSLRFNNPDDPNLSTTFSSAGNRRTFTISAWVKRGNIADDHTLFGQGGTSSGNPRGVLFFANSLRFTNNTAGNSTDTDVETNAKTRDPSAWYHAVVAVDTTQGTNSNRVKLYLNGELQTSLANSTYPDQNFEMGWNNNVLHTVGRYPNNDAYHMDGYISEFYFIDGTQYAASDFGETNDNGVWIPKDAKGDLTFGTNGFYLEFQQTGTSTNSSGMGADTSGNDNHLAVNNLAATDVTTDTPTNNFATLNPLIPVQQVPTYSEGNTKVVFKDGGNGCSPLSTFAVNSGKFYFEAKFVETSVVGRGAIGVGIVDADKYNPYGDADDAFDLESFGYSYTTDGHAKTNNSTSSFGSTYASGDIISVAVDFDNRQIYYSKNGTLQNSGDPTSGASGTGSAHNFSVGTYYFSVYGYQDENSWEMNFGNSPFSISSGNSDSRGYGNFEYAVPSGYYSLCTKNLAEYG